MKLSEVCVLDVACCTRQTTVREAARMMRKHHTGDLIVVDEAEGKRSPAGIITDRDIVIEVLAKDSGSNESARRRRDGQVFETGDRPRHG